MRQITNLRIRKKGVLYKLTKNEIKLWKNKSKNKTKYKYSTVGIYKITFTMEWSDGRTDECKVVIPHNFLTDGADVAPDVGISWLFHDYLYATHRVTKRKFNCARGTNIKFVEGKKNIDENNIAISRKEADEIMSEILKYEKEWEFKIGFDVVSECNFAGLFARSWEKSGKRGAEFRVW